MRIYSYDAGPFPLAAAVCNTGMAAEQAEAYPTKPIRIVAPFAPGGGTDLIARFTAQKITESLGQQTVVDNRPGAGGTLGAELGAKAPPDGYTFTLIAGSYAVNPSLFKLNFDSINDITPIIQLSQGPFLVARASVATGQERERNWSRSPKQNPAS